MDHPQSAQSLREYLHTNLNATTAANFDGSIGLTTPSAETVLAFSLHHGDLHWFEPADYLDPNTDVTFTFVSWEHAYELLSGRANVIDSFMRGDVRADGYLLWTFTLLALFR